MAPTTNGNAQLPPAHGVAICGIGLRLPGGIRNGHDFWDLLRNSKDARSAIPESRYNIQGFDDSLGGKEAIKVKHGYFLDEDLATLDTSFFTITKNELEKTDPQQRLLLEVVRECLEDAGEVNYRGEQVGCYVGTFGDDWLIMSAKESLQGGGYLVTGHGDLMMANRVSYEYDFRGPSMVIKTGCSASLIALHEAFRAVRNGDAVSAVVGGTSMITTPTLTSTMSAGELLAADGSCKTFDAAADGYARAEAVSAIYIKRLEDAIRDGNPIRAVISGSATNCDGKSASLVTPNGVAQEALIREAYKDAGLDLHDTAFIECHGTGTPTGDPIETSAVGRVFGESGIYIGSVKPNLGHSEGASGLTSVIKSILALEHRIIPPNIKFNNPNPKIPFSKYNLTVPVIPTPFPPDRRERISINSFGIGGSNAHVILEAYAQRGTATQNGPQNGIRNGVHNEIANGTRTDTAIQNGNANAIQADTTIQNGTTNGSRHTTTPPNGTTSPNPELILFSANTEVSLKQQISRHQDWIRLNPSSCSDAAYTRALHREHLSQRAFAILNDGGFIETSGGVKTPQEVPAIFMVFSGQGGQWPEMGKELILNDSNFRNDISSMGRILGDLRHPPPWNMLDELLKPASSSQIHKAELSQPLCTAIQVALFNKYAALGVTPTAVVGHSSGEIAAAYAAGYLSMEEAIIIAYYRGYVTTKQILDGGMAAIGIGAHDLSDFLREGVVLACENSPSSSTISGDASKVREVVEAIKQKMPDVLARALKVNMAYHSHHMIPLSSEYQQLIAAETKNQERMRPQPNAIVFFSSVTSKAMDDSPLGPSYWASNLTSPVRFSSATSNLLALKGDGLFLEIGPHSTLAGPLRQICATLSRPCNYVPALTRGKDCAASFLSSIGKMYQEGVALDLRPLFPRGKAIPGLPTYPWDHSGGSYWYESRVSKSWRSRQYPHHSLLGARVLEGTETEPQWRNILQLEDEPWLADHKIRHDVVFPFAGYVALAGEAVRQLTHSSHDVGYRLRHVVTHTALLLSDSSPTELMTSLRRHKLNDNEDSEWFDFSVTSYNGSTWIQHCGGRVAICKEAEMRSSHWKTENLPRVVNCSQIYDNLAKVGFVYGPEFRGLASVMSSTVEDVAHGQVVNNRSPQSRFPFTLHPAAIDACLQLLLVARARGLGRNIAHLCLPTAIEDLVIGPGADVMDARASIQYGNADFPFVECVADGKLVLHASGIEFRPLNDDTSEVDDVHAAARLQWLPHFDFVDKSTLFIPPSSDRAETQLQEELGLLCILETADRVRYLEPGQPHFARFRDWLNQQIGFAAAGRYKLVEDAEQYVRLSSSERQAMIDDRTTALLELPKSAFAVGARRILDNVQRIFTGEADTLDILLQDNILARIYDVMSFDYSKFVRVLSHTRPRLRILEVGAGTGGTTETILRSLVDVAGLPGYSTYTFTDVSAGFFPAAKERFAYAPNMEFKVVDVTKDPATQGLERESYDLILAANVLHATPSLKETLSNLRPLLRPDGMLVMTELCSLSRPSNYIFGNFSGWWLGEADGRPDQPYVSVSRWDEDLKSAGFTGVDMAVYDDDEPYRQFAVMMSKREAQENPKPSKVTVLSDDIEGEVARTVASSILTLGWDVTRCTFGSDDLPQDQDIISCLDLETNFFHDMTADRFAAFQRFLGSVGSSRLLWLTRPLQINCRDPLSAQTLGVARTIRSELGLQFYTLEIDSKKEQHFGPLVANIFEKILRDDERDNHSLESDKEFAINNGAICIGRYRPFSLADEVRSKSTTTQAQTTTYLDIEKPGILETLTWKSRPTAPSIPASHVEIEVRSAGLNFRDVVYAAGLISSSSSSGRKSRVPLGMEVSGTVRRLGSGVGVGGDGGGGLAVGDRVMAFTHEGGFATHVVVAESYVLKIPDDMGFEQAATVQGCFATVVYALLDAGRLRRGMSVLVHSACGGVGLAAIQVAQMMGAEVFATVGSEKKVAHLVAHYGIPRDRIFSSRDPSFLDGVMQRTGGKGVDLVLNSLPGELLHASWKCVAKHGTLLELGKRDLAGYGQLDLSRFLDNRSYCGIDVAYLVREQPMIIRDVLQRTLDFCKQGLLRPLEPVTSFKAADVKHAFRHLQAGEHIGKIILNLPEDASGLEAVPEPQLVEFDADSAYLLVGGAGGLGKSLATWLAERGAGHLVFLSRNATVSAESSSISAELESMGCSVTMVSGSINNVEDIQKAIRVSPAPIKGVFQLAMVQRDSPFSDMKWTDWIDANDPKVRGTWNLHQEFSGHSLDYFWLASSTVTVVDQPGQGNYKAGCTFLEAFCQYRHSLGLPASVLCICPINDVGYVADNPWALRNIKLQGLYTLGEKEFLENVEASLLNSSPQPSSGPVVLANAALESPWESTAQIIMGLRSELHLDDPKNPTNWRRDRRMGMYHNIPVKEASKTGGESSRLKQFLQGLADGDPGNILADESSIDFLAVETGRKIYDFLLKPDAEIDVGLSLSQMGLDSLTAIELRRWFRQAFGLQVSVLEIMGAASLRHLGETLAGKLREKHTH